MTYVLDHIYEPDRIDPDRPYSIHIFGERDGVKYQVYMGKLESSPTVSFLSSFGTKPVDNAHEP